MFIYYMRLFLHCSSQGIRASGTPHAAKEAEQGGDEAIVSSTVSTRSTTDTA